MTTSPAAGDSSQIEHRAASWGAPELPSPDSLAIGWADSSPAWSNPDPSYEALPAPERLSTQAEIDAFVESATTVVPSEPSPDHSRPALPPPEE